MRAHVPVVSFHWCGFDINMHVTPARIIIISLVVDQVVMMMVVMVLSVVMVVMVLVLVV